MYEPNYKHHIINYNKTVFATLKPKATILYYTIILCYITIIDVLFSLVMMKHPTRATFISHWQGQVVFDESSYTDSDTDDLSGAYEHL